MARGAPLRPHLSTRAPGGGVTLPPEILTLLTPKQLEAFELEQAGWGMLRMARHLGITKAAAVSRLEGAHLKLRKVGITMDSAGQWQIPDTTKPAGAGLVG